MKKIKYIAKFRGRQSGAQGIVYDITAEVEGTDKEDARINLYEKYEHISFLKLKEV